MPISSQEWAQLIITEYLGSYIEEGGGAIKFAILNNGEFISFCEITQGLAVDNGLRLFSVDARETKLHLMQELFFAISRQVDWIGEAQIFVERLFKKHGYEWKTPGEPRLLKDISEDNGVDAIILRREFNGWLTRAVMSDATMSQDFRIGMVQLCQSRLGLNQGDLVASPVIDWLTGQLSALAPLRTAQIYTRIARHNARAMLRSLCRWLVLCGHRGFMLRIDVRGVVNAAPENNALRYSTSAVLDAYEVLRQLVDDSASLASSLVLVLADSDFIDGKSTRSVDAYTALKMRIWDDVKAKRRDNPLAPTVVISG